MVQDLNKIETLYDTPAKEYAETFQDRRHKNRG